jgi:hypothetical protein
VHFWFETIQVNFRFVAIQVNFRYVAIQVNFTFVAIQVNFRFVAIQVNFRFVAIQVNFRFVAIQVHFQFLMNKMKNKKYQSVWTVHKSNRKFIERGKIDSPNTHVHDHSLSWLGTGTWIKSGRVKIVLWTQIYPLSEAMRSCKCIPHVVKCQPLHTHSFVVIKNALILKILHNIFNLRDTEVVICIILVLLRSTDGLNHHLNIR